MVLDEARMQRHEVFLAKNVAVDPAQSALLFSNPSHSCDIRNHKGNLYQVTYQSLHIKDDLVFELEGFVPQNDLQFTVAFPLSYPERDKVPRRCSTTEDQRTAGWRRYER